MAVLAEEWKIDPEFQAIPLFSQDDTNCREYMATLQEADLKVEMKQPEEIGATIATYIGPEAYGIVFVESWWYDKRLTEQIDFMVKGRILFSEDHTDFRIDSQWFRMAGKWSKLRI